MQEILPTYLTHLCGPDRVFPNAPLRDYTTFRVGGPAKYLVLVDSAAILTRLVSALDFLDEPYFILGLGANTVVADAGYDGVVIKLNRQEIYHNDNFVYASAGSQLGAVCQYARQHGLGGLEWATGIPATLGGAVFMNCGAFGGCMQDVIVLVDVLDHGVVKTLPANHLAFGYRDSIFQHEPYLILGAYLRLTPTNPTVIKAQMAKILTARQNHPHQPSAGSIFKRPHDGFFVGREIERLGLKGHTIGGAMISPDHANFIVNTGHATAADIVALIELIQTRVHAATGIWLEPEVRFIGNF